MSRFSHRPRLAVLLALDRVLSGAGRARVGLAEKASREGLVGQGGLIANYDEIGLGLARLAWWRERFASPQALRDSVGLHPLLAALVEVRAAEPVACWRDLVDFHSALLAAQAPSEKQEGLSEDEKLAFFRLWYSLNGHAWRHDVELIARSTEVWRALVSGRLSAHAEPIERLYVEACARSARPPPALALWAWLALQRGQEAHAPSLQRQVRRSCMLGPWRG